MRIRSRLLVLVLAVLVPALLTMAFAVYYVYRETQEENYRSLREMTRAMALLVDRELETREAVLQTLASSVSLDERDLAGFYQHAKRVAPRNETAVLLSDPSGRVLLNTRLPINTPARQGLSTMNELRRRYGADARIVSDVYFAPTGRAYSFAIQIPVLREGRIAYYLTMSAFASQLRNVFDDQKLPTAWAATIVDRNGFVVATNQKSMYQVGARISGLALPHIKNDSEGVTEPLGESGPKTAVFFSRAPASDWTLVISVPQQELLQGAVRAAAMMGVMLLILFSLAIGGAFAVGRKTATQIESLRRAAKRLGAGLPIKVAPSGVMEIDAVGRAMVKASDEIRRSQGDMARRVEEAVELAQRSQQALLHVQKLEALGRLTGGIAHDFNNVLQTLTTGLQVAAHLATEARAASALEACLRAVGRASDLVRQLMVFGRVQEARLETIDLARQLRAMTPMLTGGLNSSIELHLNAGDDLWPITVDPLQFELAMLNLAINARDAMPSGGTLTVHAENQTLSSPPAELAPGDYVRLAVIDTGEGMPEEVLARAVDPFFTTKGVGKGTGLGLAQAYGFARQSGGALALESKPGKGTTAVFYLPRTDCLTATSTPQTFAPTISRPGPGAAILLVEDDPLVRSVVSPALETAGFQVSVARDGEQAAQMLRSGRHFDLVFSDIVMPGKISGIDLAELIRRHYPDVGVVLATGYSEHRVPSRGVRTLSKPYHVSEMLDALKAELRARRSSRQRSAGAPSA